MPRGPGETSARDRILNEAEKLILVRGFNGTSVDMVCSAAGVTKGAFFHHFESKEALASEILRKYWLETVTALSSSRYVKTKDPLKKLIGITFFFEELFEVPKRPNACLIGNITQEVALTNPIVRATCEQIFIEWTNSLTYLIDEIVEHRAEQPRTETRGLAELIISSVEGAFILVKATNDIKSSKRTLAHLRSYLRLILE